MIPRPVIDSLTARETAMRKEGADSRPDWSGDVGAWGLVEPKVFSRQLSRKIVAHEMLRDRSAKIVCDET